jgi:hypothetical protein
MKRFVILTLLLFSLCPLICGQERRPSQILPLDLYGGIEVGPKWIKSIVVRVGTEEEGYEVKLLKTQSANTTLVQTWDGKFTPEAIEAAVQAVQRFYRQMQQEYGVPIENIHIVGSSGLIGENLQDISHEVRKFTGRTISFLDVETEVQLAIAGTIPRRYRVGETWFDNRSISLLVDIGSVKTKGGYQQLRRVSPGRPDYDYITWAVPKGTITFTDEVTGATGATGEMIAYQAFAGRAQSMSNKSLRPLIRNEVLRKPGLLNRQKTYLTGEIIWSMVTLLHPEDRQNFVPVTMNDINTFCDRVARNPEALMNPDLSRIRDISVREEAKREVESVRNTLTPKNLIGGAEILKAVASEMNFSGKKLIFARFGHLSWLLSYVRLQAVQ